MPLSSRAPAADGRQSVAVDAGKENGKNGPAGDDPVGGMHPNRIFKGALLLVVPHMDDEVLACGGTIAMLTPKKRIFAVYATDGTKSPEPIVPWRDAVSSDLGGVRIGESKQAMGLLGVPEENLEFFGFPDGRLANNEQALVGRLKEVIERIDPSDMLIPFRYDRHPDHLAINRAALIACNELTFEGNVFEYFVYHQYRLLPKKSMINYIHARHLIEIDIATVSDRKRKALDVFKSQTTKFFSWQTRPNLKPDMLDEISHTPERFLRYDAAASGPAVFDRCAAWIRTAHRLEPLIKRRKDRIAVLWDRGPGRKKGG
ncbi:MAG: PIG-L deacetylase family protein [Desulfobacterales bacterium]